MSKQTTIISALFVVLSSAVILAWSLNQPPSHESISLSDSRNGDSIEKSSGGDDFTLSDLYKEIVKIRSDLDTMKVAVSELQHSGGDSSNSGNNDADSNTVGLAELFQQYMDDPDSVAMKIAPYLDRHQLNSDKETDLYFSQLSDIDPSWSAESQAFISESISDSKLQSIATTQVNEATCKAGVCKVDISFTSNNGGKFSEEELFEAENRMLIALSTQFPDTRLKQVEKNGQISYQGYVSDRSTKLPENQLDLNDPAVIAEIRAAIQQ
ncbi:hypothetical protein [Arenicella xantha]|uniref:Uncharacterized protein n=1 Tax=Arenicella xantha TaxID=644221 RepID=A0A395JML6_9GAMM|nr:hypothetical protein [Arenicella xantha]RBP51077.1 hypothetical protein DFR28_102496 [Arenicella xantha]